MFVTNDKLEIEKENTKIRNEILLELNENNLQIKIDKIKDFLIIVFKIVLFLLIPLAFIIVTYTIGSSMGKVF